MALRAVSCKNGTKFVRNSYEVRTKFVRNSYEIRAKFVRISYEKCLTDRYCECGCYKIRTNFVRNSYELRTNFARSSNNLHELVSFLCVCGCAWSEGLLFVWAWGHGVCVPG